MTTEPERVREILGFSEPVPQWPAPLEQAVRAGFPKSALLNVARMIEPDSARANELAFSVVPKSSFSRRATLTQEQSEKTERLARLFALAEEVLGGAEPARLFLRRPHPELGGQRPLEAAATELGGRAVERVLHAIEFGLPV